MRRKMVWPSAPQAEGPQFEPEGAPLRISKLCAKFNLVFIVSFSVKEICTKKPAVICKAIQWSVVSTQSALRPTSKVQVLLNEEVACPHQWYYIGWIMNSFIVIVYLE